MKLVHSLNQRELRFTRQVLDEVRARYIVACDVEERALWEQCQELAAYYGVAMSAELTHGELVDMLTELRRWDTGRRTALQRSA